jgi:hypothetical protein
MTTMTLGGLVILDRAVISRFPSINERHSPPEQLFDAMRQLTVVDPLYLKSFSEGFVTVFPSQPFRITVL